MSAPDGSRDLIPYVGPAADGRGVSMQAKPPVTAEMLVPRKCADCGLPDLKCLPNQVPVCPVCGAAARRATMEQIL